MRQELEAAPAPQQGFAPAVLCLQGCYETGMRRDNAERFLLPRFCPAAKSWFRGFCGSLVCFGLFFFALSLSTDLKELEATVIIISS